MSPAAKIFNAVASKQDAETLGKLGYAVVLVDAADGDYSKTVEGADVPAWLLKNSFEKVASAHVANAIAYLQEEVGVETICSYGYCWGAYIGAKQSSLPNPVIKGHVPFHPSWMTEELINGDVQTMAEAISVPQLLCSAGNDPPVVREGGAMEKILQAKPSASTAASWTFLGWSTAGSVAATSRILRRRTPWRRGVELPSSFKRLTRCRLWSAECSKYNLLLKLIQYERCTQSKQKVHCTSAPAHPKSTPHHLVIGRVCANVSRCIRRALLFSGTLRTWS
ncbi:unnamed protein product [Phytophthora lilii]|uniref:Unnamed protein product n=1 Tax=Phytophthora lilii TaxID=2077276 RepID=A0A9W6TFW1_9STRA|nr:unnamed protein product [Phytophthora lilii]